MIRRHVTLSPPQEKRLKEDAEKEGIGVSELLRRIVDAYFRGKK